jgi:hypothetical protein
VNIDNTDKAGMIGVFSTVVSLLTVFINYTCLENFSGTVRICAIVASALAIGICQGFFFERVWHKVIGIGTFVGISILWTPVVVVTYGFALLYLPLLAAFAILAFFGARLGANLRANIYRKA